MAGLRVLLLMVKSFHSRMGRKAWVVMSLPCVNSQYLDCETKPLPFCPVLAIFQPILANV